MTSPGVGTVVAVISFLLRELSLGAVAFTPTLLALPRGAVPLGCWSFMLFQSVYAVVAFPPQP